MLLLTFSVWDIKRCNQESPAFRPGSMSTIIKKLGCKLVFTKLEDDGYDYSKPKIDQTLVSKAMCQICVIIEKL